MPPVTISAVGMNGESKSIEISPSETVRTLRQEFADLHGFSAFRLRFMKEDELLELGLTLADYGIVSESDLSYVLMTGVPDFAKDWGLECDLAENLKEYYEQHRLEHPACFAEPDGVWIKLKEAKEQRELDHTKLSTWSSDINLFQGDDKVNQLLASPGQTLEVTVKGSVWNNRGDSCIQQTILAMDDAKVVAEIYNGVPGGGRDISSKIKIEVPHQPGLHMLWRYTDLQYSMQDAVRNITNNHGQAVKARFPDDFVGWVIISES